MHEATPTSYVALLRGINVGGHAKVPMARLREVCAAAGYPAARTYIQSGNIVFDSQRAPDRIVAELEAAIDAEFGVHVPVLLRSRQQLDAVLDANPFSGRDIDPSRLAIVFLSATGPDVPVPQGWPEEIVPVGRHLFVHYPNGMGRSKVDGAFFARHVDGVITVRNWRTVGKIRELMNT